VGAQISKKPLTDVVERFLSILSLDSRERVDALGFYVDPQAKLILSGSTAISHRKAP